MPQLPGVVDSQNPLLAQTLSPLQSTHPAVAAMTRYNTRAPATMNTRKGGRRPREEYVSPSFSFSFNKQSSSIIVNTNRLIFFYQEISHNRFALSLNQNHRLVIIQFCKCRTLDNFTRVQKFQNVEAKISKVYFRFSK